MIGLGGFDELGLRNVQSVLFEGSQGGGAVLDGRTDAGIEGAVTLGLQVLDDLVSCILAATRRPAAKESMPAMWERNRSSAVKEVRRGLASKFRPP